MNEDPASPTLWRNRCENQLYANLQSGMEESEAIEFYLQQLSEYKTAQVLGVEAVEWGLERYKEDIYWDMRWLDPQVFFSPGACSSPGDPPNVVNYYKQQKIVLNHLNKIDDDKKKVQKKQMKIVIEFENTPDNVEAVQGFFDTMHDEFTTIDVDALSTNGWAEGMTGMQLANATIKIQDGEDL